MYSHQMSAHNNTYLLAIYLLHFLHSTIQNQIGTYSVQKQDIPTYYRWLIHYLETLEPRFSELFANVDLLLTPVSHVVCPKLDDSLRDAPWTAETADNAIRHLQFTAPVNFAGCPAASLPLSVGSESGLPVGSHLIAPMGKERLLFEVSYELEASVNWKRKLGKSATS